MINKKSLYFFVFFFPIAFIIGIFISSSFSLTFQQEFQLNWIFVIAVAIVLDLIISWRNSRDWKREKKEA